MFFSDQFKHNSGSIEHNSGKFKRNKSALRKQIFNNFQIT